MNALRLLGLFFRIGLMNELQYRANFVVQLLKSVQSLVVSLLGVAMIYQHTDTLNGWHPADLVVLLGIFVFMGGLIDTVVSPSMEKLTEDVRQGTLDFTLTKPQDAQLLTSIGQVRIWRVIDVLLGLGLTAAALAYTGWSAHLDELLTFGATLAAGAAIMYSFWLILATASFWFVRVDNIFVIFHSVYDAARWPVTIYPGWLRAILTFVVPVTFAVTMPSQALVGGLGGRLLGLTLALAVGLSVASRMLWRIGVRRYSGASA